LATTLTTAFYPKGNEAWALISMLATFAAGFVVRPFGAIIFGRLGDIVGRKHTFLVTLLLMGASTCAIGLLPGYAQIGFVAPSLLLALRLVQGLALGGEYGGAATYVAEHAPVGKRGFYTSFIQTTATLGLFVSLGVILAVQSTLSKEDFQQWGWRIPFLLSVVLVVFSYVIRRRMAESPLFARLKEEKKTSPNPLKESFGNPRNRKLVLLALFGATAGQGVVWYTGQFYALYYLQTVLNIDKVMSNIIIAIALLLGTPFFIVFGSLSDRIGRRKIMVAGCVLAAVLYLPIYMGMVHVTNEARFHAIGQAVTTNSVATDPDTGKSSPVTSVRKEYEEAIVTSKTTTKLDETGKVKLETKTEVVPKGSIMFLLSLLILVQVLFVTMVYGPIAAFLVELFPTRIRYTSLSVPYHIGNGIFGGLVPVIGKILEGGVHKLYGGLLYPIGVALMTAFIGGLFMRERREPAYEDEEAPSAVIEVPEPARL
jgi:MHS family proline/betaine transporter-like MFS transporter